MKKSKKIISLTELVVDIIIVISVIVLAFFAIPTHKKPFVNIREKNCFSNQRIVQGALEMYAMDNYTDNNVLPTSGLFDSVEQMLIEKKYLKEKLVRPDIDCKYFIFGNLFDNGTVYCSLHGTCIDYFSQNKSICYDFQSDLIKAIPIYNKSTSKNIDLTKLNEKELNDLIEELYIKKYINDLPPTGIPAEIKTERNFKPYDKCIYEIKGLFNRELSCKSHGIIPKKDK